MKNISKIIASFILISILTVATSSLYAQPAGGVPVDPSLPSGGIPTNGAVGHPVGAGATLTSGMYLLIFLAGAYGGYKLYQVRKKRGELSEEL